MNPSKQRVFLLKEQTIKQLKKLIWMSGFLNAVFFFWNLELLER